MKPQLFSLLLTASLVVASAVAVPSAPEKPEAKEIRSAAAQASYKQALEHLNNHDVSEAVIALVKAKQLALAASDLETAAQSTAELVRINAALERHEKVVGRYDEFTKNHAGHDLEPQVISNAMSALIKAGRGEEALKRSEKVIVALGGRANADLEKAIFYYSMSFLEMNKDAAAGEKLIRRLNTWPRVEALPASIRVWLLIAKIDIAEDKKYFAQPPRDRIDAFYADLMKLDRKQLPDYPLVRIVAYLHERDKGVDALPFAEEVLSRKDAEHRDAALYYKSVTLAKSEVKAKQDIAIKGFTEIIDQLKSREYTDGAMHALGMLQISHKEWAAAEKTLLRYVNDKQLNEHNPEVWFNLGLARDQQKKWLGNDGSAATAYFRCWAKYAGYFEFSCPAMNRSIEIERDHGSKQRAYDLADSWLRSMVRHTEHKIAGKHLRKTVALRDKLANDPEVTVRQKR